MTLTHRNRYLDHVHVDPPDIEALVSAPGCAGRSRVKPRPLALLACAILEAGRPLAWEEAAARLGRAGFEPKVGTLEKALRNACRGKRPIVKGPGDTVDLDLHAIELEEIIQELDLRPEPPDLHLVEDDGGRAEEPLDVETPLGMDELEIALGDAALDDFDGARQATAVLDAKGVDSLPESEIEEIMAGLTCRRPRLGETTPRAWAAAATSRGEDGVVVLNREHGGLQATRRELRRRLREGETFAREEEEDEEVLKAFLEDKRLEWEHAHQVFLSKTRSVLHVLPSPDEPVAAALLEFPPGGGDERLRVFLPGELDALRAALGEPDSVAGEDPRASFHALGVDPHRPFLIDLVPETWTARAEPGHRVARLTRKSLLRAATGHESLSRREMASLLRGGDRDAIAARLRLDVWAVASLYRLGVLFRGIPFYSGLHPVFAECVWGLPGEQSLPNFLEQAAEDGAELMFRDRDSWKLPSPWARARPGRLVGMAPGRLMMEGRRGCFELDAEQVADVRRVRPS